MTILSADYRIDWAKTKVKKNNGEWPGDKIEMDDDRREEGML